MHTYDTFFPSLLEERVYFFPSTKKSVKCIMLVAFFDFRGHNGVNSLMALFLVLANSLETSFLATSMSWNQRLSLELQFQDKSGDELLNKRSLHDSEIVLFSSCG